MLTIKKILFPTDFSEVAERAFSHASMMADRFEAELHVLNVVPPHKPEQATPMEYLAADDAREVVEEWEAARTSRVDNLPPIRVVHTQVQDVSPTVAVLEYADANGIDVIVMGTHGRSGVDRIIAGSVAEEVVRLSTCPVLTVHEEAARAIERIIVPVDFSEHSRLNVTYAREMAAMYGARLDIVHVVEEYALAPVYGIEPLVLDTPDVLDRVRNGLRTITAEAPGADVAIDYHILTGNPINEITRFAAESGARLIVIATHGLTGIKRFLLGSVTERIVRTAACPVFTIKSFGRQLVSALPSMDTDEKLSPRQTEVSS